MKPILILYATREGQTRRIAEHLAAAARSRNLAAEVFDVAHLTPELRLDSYSAAILAASVHTGKHEREMTEFVTRNAAELERHTTVFLSVSLSEAGAENPAQTPERRAQAAADVERMIREFLEETHWHPSRIRAVAGALLYTKYNFVLRFIMKMIARAEGGSTDTSQDHEYTDWAALDRVIDEVAPTAS